MTRRTLSHGKVLGWQICRHSGLSLFYQAVHHCTQKVDGPRFWKMDILVSRRQAQRLSDSLMLPQSTESFQSAGHSTQKNTTTLNITHAARLGPRLSLKMCSISPRCCFLGWRPDHSAVCKCPPHHVSTAAQRRQPSFKLPLSISHESRGGLEHNFRIKSLFLLQTLEPCQHFVKQKYPQLWSRAGMEIFSYWWSPRCKMLEENHRDAECSNSFQMRHN